MEDRKAEVAKIKTEIVNEVVKDIIDSLIRVKNILDESRAKIKNEAVKLEINGRFISEIYKDKNPPFLSSLVDESSSRSIEISDRLFGFASDDISYLSNDLEKNINYLTSVREDTIRKYLESI